MFHVLKICLDDGLTEHFELFFHVIWCTLLKIIDVINKKYCVLKRISGKNNNRK